MTETANLPDARAGFAPFSIEGQYQNGVTSRSVDAQLMISDQGAELIAEDVRLRISPADLQLTDRMSNTPRRISWGTTACFVTTDDAGSNQLRELLPGHKKANIAFRLENHLPLAIGSLVVVAALLISTMVWGIPAAANYLAFNIPESVREASAEQTMSLIDRLYVEESELPEGRKRELEAYFRNADSYPSQILFRNGSKIGANAFALPGGYVVFTDQIVELAEDDSELLGVYLHEVGHARLRHAETAVLRDSIWLVAITLLTGDISGVSDVIYTVPVALGELAFSRDLEREADDFAIDAMFAMGQDPAVLATMLERLERSHRTSNPPNNSESCERPAVESTDQAPTEMADAEVTDTEVAGAEVTDADVTNTEGTDDEKSIADTLFEYVSTHPATAERLERIRRAKPPATSANPG